MHVAYLQETPLVLYVVVLWCNLCNQNVKWWQFSTNVKTHECECSEQAVECRMTGTLCTSKCRVA